MGSAVLHGNRDNAPGQEPIEAGMVEGQGGALRPRKQISPAIHTIHRQSQQWLSIPGHPQALPPSPQLPGL